MDQPESPVKHGRENIQLGPTSIQSGIEYVQRQVRQEQEHEHALEFDKFILPPTLDPNIVYDSLANIIERLGRIESALDYLLTPWYKRLHMWLKRVLHVV